MEKVRYSLVKNEKTESSKCAVLTLLMFVIILGLATLVLTVKIFLYDHTMMDALQEDVGTTVQHVKACPNIVSRSDWKAKPPKEREDMKTPVPYVIIHHTLMDECHNIEGCCAEMRKIQDFHQDVRGWWDIGYTYLVGEDGRVYEGRNWTTVGAHAPWYNDKSIGISIMGNFTDKLPNDAAISAVHSLIECALINGILERDYILYGHRQARNGTECPGDALFKLIQTWQHWKPGNHFPPK